MPDPAAVNSMFARIARRYELANHLLSGGMDIWWRRRLVGAVRRHQPAEVLDLATGSGEVAFALSARLGAGAQIVGMDFCQPMLDQANAKLSDLAPLRRRSLSFRHGDGLALPLAEASFDAVTISFGLRNMADRALSLREIYRILRPGGRLFVLEFSQPQAWLRPLYYFYLRRLLPAIAGAVTGDRAAYVYLNETIEQFPGRTALAAEIKGAGFDPVTARGMTFGTVALHEAQK